MGTVTIGVSVAVPEPYGSFLQERRAGFGDPAAHGIPTHVTLLPPTAVEQDTLPEIERHLAAVAAEGQPFAMRLNGTDSFRPLSPVVFVRVVEGAEACAELQARVRTVSGPCARELQFPYHPHVTIAHGIADAAMDRARDELESFEASWTVAGFALYQQGTNDIWRLERDYVFGGRPSAAVPRQTGLYSPFGPGC